PGTDRGDRVRRAPGPAVRPRALARPVGRVRAQGRAPGARTRRRPLMRDDDRSEDPAAEVESGEVTFASRTGGHEGALEDLFAEEERPPKRLVLVVMVEEDAADLVAALEADGVGARLGDRTDDGGVEILVHDSKLPAAQAVLVEYTGDPTLVDAVVEAEDQP